MTAADFARLEEVARRPLVPLPKHPRDVPWPVRDWPVAEPPDGVDLDDLLDEAFDERGSLSRTFAVVVIHRGAIVAERYGGVIEFFDRPPRPVRESTPLPSWSMAKSMLHSAVGILVGEGRLSLDGPAPVPAWADRRDPRHEISLEHMLDMREGLDFSEDYVDAESSDVIEMLFGEASHDVAAFASGKRERWKPGERFSYSSGTTNVVAGILKRLVGPSDRCEKWLRERLFGPIGAASVEPGFDDSGTWVASSFVNTTARDYTRFGELQLRDGIWSGHRVLPKGWVDHGRLARSVDEESGHLYGAHWWVLGDAWGTFRAAGYEGQAIVISPGLDLVIVRLGKTPQERQEALQCWRDAIIEEFAAARD